MPLVPLTLHLRYPMSRFRVYLLLILLGCATFSVCLAACRQPAGIFSLSNGPGNPFQNDLIVEAPFVDGYALRVPWKDYSPQKGVYNFTRIINAISRLNTLNQQLSLLLSGPVSTTSSDPSWVQSEVPSNQLWTFTSGVVVITRVVPWSDIQLQYWENFLSNMSALQVPLGDGTTIALKDHPRFTIINAGIPGLGDVRDLPPAKFFFHVNMTGYTRDLFTTSFNNSLQIVHRYFPRQYKFTGFWTVTDDVPSPPLWTHLENVVFRPWAHIVGPWQENLAASRTSATPTASFAATLANAATYSFTGFQMLKAWSYYDEKNLGGQPSDAMYYANTTFNSLYSEVYHPDFSNSSFLAGFEQFHQDLLSFCGGSLVDSNQPLSATPLSGPTTSNAPTASSNPPTASATAPNQMSSPRAAPTSSTIAPQSAPRVSVASSIEFSSILLVSIVFAMMM